MSIERPSTSAKLSHDNFEFLYDRRRSLRPYEVSISSLVDLCVRIVRELHTKGELSLEPAQLQKLLGLDRRDILAGTSRQKSEKAWRTTGSPSFPPEKRGEK